MKVRNNYIKLWIIISLYAFTVRVGYCELRFYANVYIKIELDKHGARMASSLATKCVLRGLQTIWGRTPTNAKFNSRVHELVFL